MSEKAPQFESNENLEPVEIKSAQKHEAKQSLPKKHETKSKSTEVNKHKVEELAHKADKRAETTEHIKHNLDHLNDQDKEQANHYSAPKSINQTLTQARHHLKPAEKTFSKVIHNPKVEVASDIVGASIARPSGLLYGALFSFIGSVTFLVLAKRYGYEYSAFMAVLSFAGGFVIGLIIEAIVRLVSLGKKSES